MLSRFLVACSRTIVWKESRSLLILVLAFFTFRMTLGYLIFPPVRDSRTPSSAVTILESYLPLQAYGFAWLIITLILVVAAFTKHDAFALGTVTGMNTLWGLSYFWDFLAADGSTRAWLTSLLYMGLVILTVVTSRIKNPYALEVSRGTNDVLGT